QRRHPGIRPGCILHAEPPCERASRVRKSISRRSLSVRECGRQGHVRCEPGEIRTAVRRLLCFRSLEGQDRSGEDRGVSNRQWASIDAVRPRHQERIQQGHARKFAEGRPKLAGNCCEGKTMSMRTETLNEKTVSSD